MHGHLVCRQRLIGVSSVCSMGSSKPITTAVPSTYITLLDDESFFKWWTTGCVFPLVSTPHAVFPLTGLLSRVYFCALQIGGWHACTVWNLLFLVWRVFEMQFLNIFYLHWMKITEGKKSQKMWGRTQESWKDDRAEWPVAIIILNLLGRHQKTLFCLLFFLKKILEIIWHTSRTLTIKDSSYIKHVTKRGGCGLLSCRVYIVIFTHSVSDTHDCNSVLT